MDLGRERAPLALHRRAQQLAPQPRGRDPGARAAGRAGSGRSRSAGRSGSARWRWRSRRPPSPVRRDERQDHPVARGRRERVLDEPARGLAQHDRRAGGDRQPPRLLVEGELLGGGVADVAAQDRVPVGVGQVERGVAAGAAPRASPPARRPRARAARRCRRARARRARPPRARSGPPVRSRRDTTPRARDHRRRPPADARGHRGAAGRRPADRGGRPGLGRARGRRAGRAAEARRRAAGRRDAGHRRRRGVRRDPRAASRACGC